MRIGSKPGCRWTTFSDLFKYGAQLKATVQRYLKAQGLHAEAAAPAPMPS